MMVVCPTGDASSRQRLHHDRADRVQVRLDGRRESRPPLGREVARRAEHDAGERLLRVRPEAERVHALCDPEVGDLGQAIVLQQDVAGLDVAVKHAQSVRGRQCRKRLGQHAHNSETVERACRDLVPERPTAETLHDEVAEGALLPEVEDRDDVRVDEPRRQPSLLLEAARHARQGCRVGTQDLDGDPAFQTLVVRVEHPRHSTFAEQAEKPVAAAHSARRSADFHPYGLAPTDLPSHRLCECAFDLGFGGSDLRVAPGVPSLRAGGHCERCMNSPR